MVNNTKVIAVAGINTNNQKTALNTLLITSSLKMVENTQPTTWLKSLNLLILSALLP
jgi:hypothetical protein